MKAEILNGIYLARVDLAEHIKPRDDFEIAVINALGEISWDEAMQAIQQHRRAQPQPVDTCVKCRAPLPPVAEWSGPACYSCTVKAEQGQL